MGRGRQIRIAHPQVDDIHTLRLNLDLEAVNLLKEIRRELFETI
jgi:hypothetical protein